MSTEDLRFVPVCAVTDVPNGKHKAFEVEGVSVLLVNLNREFHAVHNRCTHLDFPLEGGRQMGWELMCRQHGARFDIRSGRALGGPAVNPIPVYKTRVVGDIVEVALP